MRTSLSISCLVLAILAAAPGSPSASPIIGAPSSLNYGSVALGSFANQTLTIQNNGDATLSVTSMVFSGLDANQFGFPSPPTVPFTVPVGGSVSFTTRFTPTFTGLKNATLTISSNDPVTPAKAVALSGAGTAPIITVSPGALAFGNVNLLASADLPVTIGNNGTALLSVSGLAIAGADASSFSLVSPPSVPFTVAPGASITFNTRFAPTSAGAKSASFNVTSNDPVTPVKITSMSGTGVGPAIVTTPAATLDFGGVHVGQTAILPLLITNGGGGILSVTSLSFTGSDAALFGLQFTPSLPLSIGAGATVPLSVRFSPLTIGAKTATFTLNSNDPAAPIKAIELLGLSIRPEPVIAGVRDVPNDEGGRVKLSWDASTFDTQTSPVVDHYWIFRSVPPQVARAAIETGATPRALARIGKGTDPSAPEILAGARPLPALFTSQEAQATIYWELLATVPALHFINGYSYIAATLSDSTPVSNPFTLFMVMALNAANTSHWDSSPDSGYSVDNLGPAAPAPFTGAYLNGATHLHWGQSPEPDLAAYRLYRGASANFVPGPASLIAAIPDTGFVDSGPTGSYYKLSAVDLHGNPSPFALLTPDHTLDAPGAEAAAFALARPSPNPAVASADVEFSLPAARGVTLEIYDGQGRRVRTLVRGPRPAGRQSVRWDGRNDQGGIVRSGVFFVKLASAERSITVRFTLLR